jgi:dTDP-4-dehydrorhamnose reductase
MKLKILLTGANGQVGRELKHYLSRLGDVIALDRRQLDLSDFTAIRHTFRESRPHLIVNAAAYTAVEKAESDCRMAQAVNAEAPEVMAEEAKKIGAALVHYSTDYVFDGSKSAPYEEYEAPCPINVYGKTKLAGEQAIQRAGVPYLIFRTAWVYATRGRNFLSTILRLASQREELRVVEDQIGSPTWSRMIALGTAQILARIRSQESGLSRLAELSGVYHLTAAGQASWYEFARAILEEYSNSSQLGTWSAAGADRQPLPVRRVVPIPSCHYPTRARRPAYSVLSNNKLRQTFGVELPHWRSQLHLAFSEANANDVQPISVVHSF